MKSIWVVLLQLFFLLSFSSAMGAEMDFKRYEGWGFTSQAELAELPEYCIAKFSDFGSGDKRLFHKWQNIIGQDFIHFHHFCRGLNMLNRSKRERDDKNRIEMLKTAVREMRYTDKQSSRKLNPKWRLIFHKNIGTALMLSGQHQEAYIEFQKAKILSEKLKAQ